jgi:alpha-glucosidase (family GH31 glycosyl hydrolase)
MRIRTHLVVLTFLSLSAAGLATAQDLSPGAVVGSYTREGNAVTFKTDAATVRLEFCTSAIVRVRVTFSDRFADDEPVMVVRYAWPPVPMTARDEGDRFEFATGSLAVHVRKAPLQLVFFDAKQGRLIAGDAPGSGGGVTRSGPSVRARMRLSPTEQFFGFGERMDRFAWRGHSVTLNVGRGQHPDHDLGAYRIDAANYCPVPFFVSTNGYGIFFHTDRQTTWDMGESAADAYTFAADAPEMDYYFIEGPSPRDIVSRYTSLTGRSPLLPKAAYGINFGTYSGGTWGHEDQASQDYVVNLAKRFRDERIPLDVIHLDSTWRRFGKLGGRNATSFEWRAPGFPDPAAMFRALRDLHVSLVGLHVRPRLDNGDSTNLLDEARAAGVIADTPTRNIVNFFDDRAVEWWWRHAVGPKAEQGAGFLKSDEGSVFPGEGPHNLFPIVYAKAAYESFQKHLGRRGFNLTREGYAGIQRYPYIWAGDWPSRWKFFAPVVRGGLNLALSGVGIWGHNAGGFEEVATEELYIRWTAFGFFNPVSHFLGMEHPTYKEPWRYGERAVAAFRKYAQLRYRLMPYIYTLAHQVYAEGVPMMRPLVLEYPDDPRVYAIDDQYLFGDALMIAPVTQEGASGRSIYLPAGTWIDYWTGARHDGGRTIVYPAAVDVLPILVRAGSILPMQPDMAYIGEKPVDPLTLDIYPQGRSRYELYEDDGMSLGYQEGEYATTTVVCDDTARGIALTVAAPVGRFVVSPRAYEFKVHLDAAPRAVKIDGGAWEHDAGARVLAVKTDPARKSLTARVQIEK